MSTTQGIEFPDDPDLNSTGNGPGDDERSPQDDEEHQDGPEGQDNPDDAADDSGDGETFPRSYVEKLRKESKGYRDRAKKGETAFSRLTEATMKSATTGILVDSSDLTYDEETMSDDDGFPDPEKIADAAKDLTARKPHLAPRRPRGDIGQGSHGKSDEFSLAGMLRDNAG